MSKPKSVQMYATTSSNLKAFGHDAEEQRLHVEFKGGGLYAYDGVSEELFNQLRDAESKGKFFHAEIQNKFKFRKIK